MATQWSIDQFSPQLQEELTRKEEIRKMYRLKYAYYKIANNVINTSTLTDFHQNVIYKRALYQHDTGPSEHVQRLRKIYWHEKVDDLICALSYDHTHTRRQLMLILKDIVEKLFFADLRTAIGYTPTHPITDIQEQPNNNTTEVSQRQSYWENLSDVIQH